MSCEVRIHNGCIDWRVRLPGNAERWWGWTKAGCVDRMHLVPLNVSHIVKEIKIVSWMKYFRALGACVREAH